MVVLFKHNPKVYLETSQKFKMEIFAKRVSGDVSLGSEYPYWNEINFLQIVEKAEWFHRLIFFRSCQIFGMELFTEIIMLKKLNAVNSLSSNQTKWSNTLRQFAGNSWRIVWACLTILWDWRLKGQLFLQETSMIVVCQGSKYFNGHLHFTEISLFLYKYRGVFRTQLNIYDGVL